MFEPRSLAQIQTEFQQTLLAQSTALSDLSPGSVVSALSRAFSAVQLQADLKLTELFQDFYLYSATGLALDQKAADYGLTRKPGAYATGFVLAISRTQPFNVESGTILTEPLSGLQFEILLDQVTQVATFTEMKLPVRCTTVGVSGNLAAGTRLIASAFPQGAFIIGAHRTSVGQVCGDLQNGLNRETDEELRSRVQKVILYSQSATEEAIRSVLLQEQTVPWVSLRYPQPGIIQVWIDNPTILSAAELERLRQVILPLKPVGVPLVSTHQVERVLTRVNVQVQPTADVDLQSLTDELIGVVHSYLLDLGLGESLRRADLILQLESLPGILTVTLPLPAKDVSVETLQVVRSQEVWVTYETR